MILRDERNDADELSTELRVISSKTMVKAVVLAAGRGARLKSTKAKVLHKIFDKPILAWVLDSLADVELEDIIVVSGYKAEEVNDFLHAYPVNIALQKDQMGTGHAVSMAKEFLQDYEGTVLVLNGDSPLIKPETINELIQFHQENVLDVTFLSCSLDRPNGYGRVIRKGNNIVSIKEDRDCSEAEKAIKEVNAGVYCFEWKTIAKGLDSLRNDNAQEEYYLTDLIAWAYLQGLSTATVELRNPYEVIGVNTREDLALVCKLQNEANLQQLMHNGVTIIDPSNTMISPDADIGADTVIFPGTYIQRKVVIGTNCRIGPNTSIFGPAEIGNNCVVVQSHLSRSCIADDSYIGPFAHIREGSDIGTGVKIGSFVEVKNSSIGDYSSAAHLAYLGDAKIKNRVNLGAGTVIANYDHRTGEKHSCIINSNVSTGANSVLIAPIEIGESSTIAAGSVITEDVPSDTLAIARPRQIIKKQKSPSK